MSTTCPSPKASPQTGSSTEAHGLVNVIGDEQDWLGILTRILREPPSHFDARSAWLAFSQISRQQNTSLLSLGERLDLVGRFISIAEKDYTNAADYRIWGLRSIRILEEMELHVDSEALFGRQWRYYSARAHAIIGDLERAITLARSFRTSSAKKKEGDLALSIFESVVIACNRYHGAYRAIRFIISEWDTLALHLVHKNPRLHSRTTSVGNSLQQTVYNIVESLPNPVSFFQDSFDVDQLDGRRVGELLVRALCDRNLPKMAYSVMEEMGSRKVSVPASLRFTLIRRLAKAQSFREANLLYSTLLEELPLNAKGKLFHSTGLYLFARQGAVGRAVEHYGVLEDRGWVTHGDSVMLMYAYAVLGKTTEVVDLFNAFFSNDGSRRMQSKPSVAHYSVVIFGHAQRGDIAGMNAWLDMMAKAGIPPNLIVYTIILQSFVMRGEVDSAAAVLDRIREAGLKPNVVAYTSMITLFAQRGEPAAAEAIYKRAISEGNTPDRKMITSLMNAHVEAGSWKGVIRAFGYLKNAPTVRLRLSVEVYNTLLKAYVLIGAPFRVVSRIFRQLEDYGIRPDMRSYALLIQSASDAGFMDVAMDIFQEVKRLKPVLDEADSSANVYIFTILMAGFLRLGDKQRAKALFDDMREHNIQPSSVTFGAILKSYGNEKTEDSLRLAEEILGSILKDGNRPWLPPRQGVSALENIFRPLMAVYNRQGMAEDVERLMEELLEAGGQPTLGLLTLLIDVYRRIGRTEMVLQLWPRILQLGHKQISNVMYGEIHEPRSSNNLSPSASLFCIPLSILTDALSAAGLHSQLSLEWKKLKEGGAWFDSHNWNHLVVALIRAGEPEKAFKVIEKVILPYGRRSKERETTTREQQPSSPLVADEEPQVDIVREAPLHRPSRRSTASKLSSSKLRDSDPEQSGDFAHQLDLLYQIPLSWNVWRPHNATLRLLSRVLAHLKAGGRIRPTGDELDFGSGDQDAQGRAEQIEEASRILNRISADCPDAVRIVQEFDLKKASLTENPYD